MTAVLRTEGLRVRRDGVCVLDGVDLAVDPGEVVAVLGPNGAGKSTLLQAIAGLLPVAGGTLAVQGRAALALQGSELARRTVRANVELALAWWGAPRHERPERAGAALQALGAAHLAPRAAATLSGGERRRVHLARAVALRPDLLLLDEPFAGLDPPARAGLLRDAAGALRAAAGATLVVVHDRAEAWALADRLVVLLGGRVAAEGAPGALLESPPTAAVARFLGFDGELDEAGGILLTRPADVRLDRDGDRSGTVRAVVPLEDGARVEVALPAGRLYAVSPLPAPAVGAAVRVRVTGGVRFSAGR